MQYICKKCRWQKSCEDHEGLTRDIQDCGDFKPRVSRKRVPYVEIEVLGGVAYVTKTAGVIVELIDHDNNNAEVERWEESEVVK